MTEARNTQVDEMVKHFRPPVWLSPRLEERMKHRSEEEQALCQVLMFSAFIREIGPGSPEQGRVHVMLPSSTNGAWEEFVFWGERPGQSLHLFLPEEGP